MFKDFRELPLLMKSFVIWLFIIVIGICVAGYLYISSSVKELDYTIPVDTYTVLDVRESDGRVSFVLENDEGSRYYDIVRDNYDAGKTFRESAVIVPGDVVEYDGESIVRVRK